MILGLESTHSVLTSKNKIIKKIGINKKTRAFDDETAIDLGIKAANKLKKCKAIIKRI